VDLLRIAARIAAVPTESKIRHKGLKKFDLSEFKKLDTADEMHEYAFYRLQNLGRGSSRAVYALTSTKVLKIAVALHGEGTSDAGVAQNKAEVQVMSNTRTRPWCAAVYEFDPQYRWLISELVRPLESPEEFKQLSGSNFRAMREAIKYKRETGADADELMKWAEDQGTKFGYLSRETADMLDDLDDSGMDLADLGIVEHFGKSAAGNLVVLDYGFTSGIYDEFYKENTGGGAGSDFETGWSGAGSPAED